MLRILPSDPKHPKLPPLDLLDILLSRILVVARKVIGRVASDPIGEFDDLLSETAHGLGIHVGFRDKFAHFDLRRVSILFRQREMEEREKAQREERTDTYQ